LFAVIFLRLLCPEIVGMGAPRRFLAAGLSAVFIILYTLLVGALQGFTLLRIDQNGWIELTTDGEQLWVEVERK